MGLRLRAEGGSTKLYTPLLIVKDNYKSMRVMHSLDVLSYCTKN